MSNIQKNKNLKTKFLLLIKASRPIFWILPLIIFSIALFLSKAQITLIAIMQFILLSVPFCLLLFGVNDVYDYKTDLINPRKKSIEGIILHPKNRALILKSSFFAGVFLILSSLITLNILNICAMTILLFISIFYSVPPMRFKEIPIVDSISNGTALFCIALLGFSFGDVSSELLIKSIFVSFCGMAAHALTTIPDYSFDKKAKQKTFSTFFGKRIPAMFAFIVFLLTLFFAHIQTMLINYYLVLCSLGALVVFMHPNEKFSLIVAKTLFFLFLLLAIIFTMLIV